MGAVRGLTGGPGAAMRGLVVGVKGLVEVMADSHGNTFVFNRQCDDWVEMDDLVQTLFILSYIINHIQM